MGKKERTKHRKIKKKNETILLRESRVRTPFTEKPECMPNV